MSLHDGGKYDGGFALVEMVQAQRGLSPREIEIFLATGQKPDLSQPPPEELEAIDGDTQVMPLEDAAALLSGGALTASSFFDFDPSHGVSPLYEVVRPKVAAFRFDPHQPRADDGRWSDGGSLLTKPRNIDEFTKRLRKASTGRRALSAAKSNADWRKKDPLKDQCAEFYQGAGDSINGPLRRGSALPPKPRVVVRELDAMLAESQLKRDVQVLRGVGDPSHIFGHAWSDYGDNAGLEWEDDAFVSATTDEETAKYFATARPGRTPTVMRILVPKGTPALQLESDRFAQWELLLGRGYHYRIVEDSGYGTRPRELSVEVIAPGVQAITAAAEVDDDNDDDVSENVPRTDDDVSRFIDDGEPVRIIAAPDRDDDDVTSAAFRFDPHQPRDKDGQWTDGPLGGVETLVKKTVASTKKVTPAVIYKKQDDGAVVGHSSSGQRMRWDAGRKKFIVEKHKNDSWVEESAHTKTSAYNEFKNPDKWFEPTETSTENEPSSPSLTPEPAPVDTDTTAETPELPASKPVEGMEANNAPPLHRLSNMQGAEKASADAYEHSSSHINWMLREPSEKWSERPDWSDQVAAETKQHISGLDSAMEKSKLPTPIVTYRGIDNLPALFGRHDNLEGAEVTDPAFMSTTTNPGTAAQFFVAGGMASARGKEFAHESAVLRLTVPEGIGAITLTPDGSNVGEVLLERGLKLRVKADLGEQDFKELWSDKMRRVRVLDVEVVKADVADNGLLVPSDVVDTHVSDVLDAPQVEVPEIPKQSTKKAASPKLTAMERAAVKRWQGATHSKIQKALRAQDTTPEVKLLDSAIEKSPPLGKTTLYRGLTPDFLPDDLKTPGGVFTDLGYLATSKSKPNDTMFENYHHVIISTPDGAKGLDVGSGPYGEVLLPRGSRLRIDRVEQNRTMPGSTLPLYDVHATLLTDDEHKSSDAEVALPDVPKAEAIPEQAAPVKLSPPKLPPKPDDIHHGFGSAKVGYGPERQAIQSYRFGAYIKVNKQLRTGKPQKGTGTSNPTEVINSLDKVMNDNITTEDTYVWRGMNVAPGDLAVGSILKDKGFLSTTKARTTAEHFSWSPPDASSSGEHKPVLMNIKVPKGSKALDFGGGEQEVLLNRNSNMKITNVMTNKNGLTIVNVELTDEEPAAPAIELPDVVDIPSVPTPLSAADEHNLAAFNDMLAEFESQARPWRELQATMTDKSGTGKLLTKWDLMEDQEAKNQLARLVKSAKPIAEHELALRMKRDGQPWGSLPDENASHWEQAKKSTLSAVMKPTEDSAKIDKLSDLYRIYDKKTTENNASLRSGNPSKTALSWRSRMRRFLRSQNTTKDSVVYRIAALRPEHIMNMRPGFVMIDKGSMSTADDKFGADSYLDARVSVAPGTIGTTFEIRVPKGMPVGDAEYGEYVFDFETPMRIISSKRENGTVNVVAELLTPEQAKELAKNG